MEAGQWAVQASFFLRAVNTAVTAVLPSQN